MRYAIETLWHERKRYLAGTLAVAFSALLMSLLVGVLIGLVSTVSAPVDQSTADIWIAAANTPSADGGIPIPKRWANRLLMDSNVNGADSYIQSFSYWKNAAVGSVLCIVCGLNLDDDSLCPIVKLTKEQRVALTEVGAVLLDDRDCHRLGIRKIGQTAEVANRRVRVVGFVNDLGSMTAPYVLCSQATARRLLRMDRARTTYVLGKVDDPTQLDSVLQKLRTTPDIAVYSKEEFSFLSRMHWIATTKAGAAVAFVASLGMVVGAIITSQTLYAATMASIKELAVLRALGIPRWRMNLFVLQQSLLIGVVGLCIGLPLARVTALLARSLGARALLPDWLLLITALVTLPMALISGLVALRSLHQADPARLLR